MSELLRPAREDSGVCLLKDILGPASGLALVGGCIRERLSSGGDTDIDLAVRYEPLQVKKLLEERGIRVVETGIDHGTVLAVIEGRHYELTTFRVPGPRVGNRYSQTLEEDLAGRDFTINAIAWDLIAGKLVDPFLGIADLEAGRLSAVGDAHARLTEDPLRILRVIRFGYAAGRTVDPATEQAAKALGRLLTGVSVERIRSEIEHILLASHAAEGFRALAQLELLPYTIPELIQTIGVEQNDFHVHDVFEHTLDVITNAPVERILRLTALFHDMGKPATLSVDEQGRRHFYLHEKISTDICREVMKRLRYSHDDIDTVSLLVATHMRPLTCGPQGVRRLMRDLGPHLDRWFQFKHADKPPRGEPREFQEGVENFLRLLGDERRRTVGSVFSALAVRGEDVMAAGIPRGPRVGAILKQLHEEVLDEPERNSREYLLERIRELVK